MTGTGTGTGPGTGPGIHRRYVLAAGIGCHLPARVNYGTGWRRVGPGTDLGPNTFSVYGLSNVELIAKLEFNNCMKAFALL